MIRCQIILYACPTLRFRVWIRVRVDVHTPSVLVRLLSFKRTERGLTLKFLILRRVVNKLIFEEVKIPGGCLRAGECERRTRILWFWKTQLHKIADFNVANCLVGRICYINCERDGIIISFRRRFVQEL